ncbi:MAG: Ig-like domain-containing protein [Bacteroidales bacterium]
MRRLLFFTLLGIWIIALFPRCAKIVAPTGGSKDTLAPVMIRSNPKMNATNFLGHEVVFEFDEYVQLKDVQQKMLVSPPLKNRPQVKLRGKKIELDISDTLKDNTTYTVYMGDAIADNNEGNPIKSFEFAFSTGATIDTLSYPGMVINSFSGEPVEGALVMLYDTFADSLPYTQLPKHIAKTNKKGEFKINNLQYIDYKLVAITDENSDYKYNQGAENIAFSDSILHRESLIDSTKRQRLTLRSFAEELPNQIITGYERKEKRMLELNFSRVPVGGFTLKPLVDTAATNWYTTESDPNGDTVKIWITADNLANTDTLELLTNYLKTDSLNALHPQTDTLKFVYANADDAENETRKSKSRKKDKDKEEATKPDVFSIITLVKNGDQVKPNAPFEFGLPMPAKKVDPSMLLILNETDSIMEPPVNILADSLNPRIYRFNKDWKPNVSYKMLMLPGLFESLESLKNDTIRLTLKGADPESYGTIIIKTSNVSKGIIAELLTEKGNVIKAKTAVGNQPITFAYLSPGKYKLRFIEDLNCNGIWDTGNYLKRIQPERIFEFTEGKNKGVLNIRANWENEIQFAIPKP